jgi:ABC-type dipeptide/oligopeptide/nickel transport system permease component
VSLAAFALRRALVTVPLIVLVMLATFAAMRGAGGSPFTPPEGYVLVPESYERIIRRHYHLDEPWIVEFAYYAKNVFTFDFGPSMVQRHLVVTDVVRNAFPVTLELVGLAAAWAILLGVPLGVVAAVRRGSGVDLLATSAASLVLVVPVFFVAFVLSKYLIFEWHVIEPGWETRSSKAVASFTLALGPVGYVARLIRTSVVETLEQDFVRTARAKGLREARVVWVHVLKNSLVPALSAAVPMLALLITGAFFVETSFRIPGASSFFVEGALTRDYPLLLGLTVALAIVVLVANFVADVAVAILDPRIRESR